MSSKQEWSMPSFSNKYVQQQKKVFIPYFQGTENPHFFKEFQKKETMLFFKVITNTTHNEKNSGNVLLLRGAISLHSDLSYVTTEQLMSLIGDYLLQTQPTVCFFHVFDATI
jgi:hypothetical protein